MKSVTDQVIDELMRPFAAGIVASALKRVQWAATRRDVFSEGLLVNHQSALTDQGWQLAMEFMILELFALRSMANSAVGERHWQFMRPLVDACGRQMASARFPEEDESACDVALQLFAERYNRRHTEYGQWPLLPPSSGKSVPGADVGDARSRGDWRGTVPWEAATLIAEEIFTGDAAKAAGNYLSVMFVIVVGSSVQGYATLKKVFTDLAGIVEPS
jgi:hypothetical protein